MDVFRIKIIAYFFLLFCVSKFTHAQKYITKTGHAYFMSHTDAIDIDGTNHQVATILDVSTGDIVVIVLIKAFEFTLATADKHFNETYMESDKYPKATFKAKIPMLTKINVSKDGEYEATAKGILTIHGETNEIEESGTVAVKNGNILIKCKFNIFIDNYKIKVPKSVEDRVAKQVDVKIDLSLTPR